MSRRIIMIGLLAMSMVALLATNASAIGGWFSTKGVLCHEIVKGVSGKEISTGAAGATCQVFNVFSAIVWCTNQPNSGFLQGQAAFNIYTFPAGFQDSLDAQCDKQRGRCNYDIILNATIVGQPHPACPNDNWTVVDVVPIEMDGIFTEITCTSPTTGKVVACDADNDGQIDLGVIVTIGETLSQHCTLPSPETLQFGETRLYDCVPTSP